MRWDALYVDVLKEVLNQGDFIESSGRTSSIGGGRRTKEVRNHRFTLPDPRDRILCNGVRLFNPFTAIARFFWMLSGSDRLKDIEIYEPRVSQFSDDALSVPGSDYGRRLFMPEPGLDQIKALIRRLKDDDSTRRAMAAIYAPEDAVRDSKDIPCAIGLAFHARKGLLHVTTIMRSNAAWGLLPYNLFEFTLLGELVSVQTGIPLGDYTHIALSMHLYESEIALATEASQSVADDLLQPMAPMPETKPEDLKRVQRWEADLRYGSGALNTTNYLDYMTSCRDECHPYWVQLCLPLLAWFLAQNKKVGLALRVLEEIQEPLRSVLRKHPALSGADVPDLADDQTMLQSRANLFDYADQAVLDDERREHLWKKYETEYRTGIENAPKSERRRQASITVRDWRSRDDKDRAGARQTKLFDDEE
jgi:thymidylate synthase